jgi:hypothetical protein
MDAKLEVKLIDLTQKYIDNEVAQQSIQFNREILKNLNERALNRAFKLDQSRT